MNGAEVRVFAQRHEVVLARRLQRLDGFVSPAGVGTERNGGVLQPHREEGRRDHGLRALLFPSDVGQARAIQCFQVRR